MLNLSLCFRGALVVCFAASPADAEGGPHTPSEIVERMSSVQAAYAHGTWKFEAKRPLQKLEFRFVFSKSGAYSKIERLGADGKVLAGFVCGDGNSFRVSRTTSNDLYQLTEMQRCEDCALALHDRDPMNDLIQNVWCGALGMEELLAPRKGVIVSILEHNRDGQMVVRIRRQRETPAGERKTEVDLRPDLGWVADRIAVPFAGEPGKPVEMSVKYLEYDGLVNGVGRLRSMATYSEMPGVARACEAQYQIISSNADQLNASEFRPEHYGIAAPSGGATIRGNTRLYIIFASAIAVIIAIWWYLRRRIGN